jgi:hypothetical protein
LSVELRGSPEQLARISRQLREESRRGLERELNKALREAAKPFKRELGEAAMSRLPNAGGLNRRVAKARVGVRDRRGMGRGVQITAGTRRSQLQQINQGYVVHPVFGGDVRVRQALPRGFADDAAKASEAEVRKGIEKATARSADRIERAGRGL